MSEEKICVELSRAEALVLFEFLYRFSDKEQLAIADQAEERVLWNIHGSLEQTLVEPFMRNYDELLEEARGQVRDKNS